MNSYFSKYYINNQNDYSSDIFYKKYCKYKKKYIDAKTNYKKEYNMKGGADPKVVNPYNKISDQYLQNIDKTRDTNRVLAECEKHNINPLESSIIDIGSGHGDDSLSLSFYFNRVYGFDISPDMLEESEKNKKRLQEIRDKFNPDKVIFKMGSFYERLVIEKPVNVILLNNTIHYAEENTVKIIMDNLLEHLNKDGIIIILEPERDAMFGDPKLNQLGELRDSKLKKINDVRSEIREYLENYTQKVKTSFFNHLTDKDGKIRTFMIVIKKN